MFKSFLELKNKLNRHRDFDFWPTGSKVSKVEGTRWAQFNGVGLSLLGLANF